jgi:hypothetical protein
MMAAARHGALLLAWTVAVVFLTWPLGAHITTRLPGVAMGGPLDALLLGSALSHESRALVRDVTTLPDAPIYWPAPRALFYGEAGFGAVPYFMPPFLATGNPTLALNVVLLLGLVLTAWSMHRVVASLTGSEPAGFVAGAVVVTTPWIVWAWLPAAPSYAILQYFPWIMLLAARPSSRLATAAALLGLVVVQGLTSVYVAVPLLGTLGVLGCARLVRRTTRPAGVALLAVLAAGAAVLALMYSGYALVHRDNPHLETQTLWLAKPIDPPPAVLGTAARLGPLAVPPAAVALIVVGIVAAAASSGWRSLATLPWTIGWLWTGVGIMMAIRPRADWHASLLAAPHSLLARFTPLYDVIRIPERLGLAALMGIAVLAGVAFATCARVFTRGRLAPTLALLAVCVGTMYVTCQRNIDTPWLALHPLPRSYPLAPSVPPPAPPLMAVLARSGGPLLELPAGTHPWRNARAMYRAIYHRRALVNGYSGYWPAGFPERMALADRLPDPEALDELRRATGLELILVHTAEYRGSQRAAWEAPRRDEGKTRLVPVARDGDDILFRIVPPAADG